MSNLYGLFSLAFINFLTVFKQRTKSIINDTAIFLNQFEDLDLVQDVYKNEFILFLFFLRINKVSHYYLIITI